MAQRKDGKAGVLEIWSLAMDQQAAHKVEGPEADYFYGTVLEAALPCDKRLEQVQVYAEWLSESRGIHWPNLYHRVVSYCLDKQQHGRAFRWHMRLVAEFDPGSDAFSRLLLRHVHNPEENIQQTLRSLYVTSRHHNLYDVLIPRLFDHGRSRLAIEWRDLCQSFSDVPQPGSSSRKFLRFLAAYYPARRLSREEQLVEGTVSATSQVRPGPVHVRRDSLLGYRSARGSKPLKDSLGARLFASSWIPVDFAFHALQGLGVRTLGPLCLQSLALRDPKAEIVLSRLKQLEQFDIQVGESVYSKAVRHFAETGNDELLDAILHTDIHPEVFDDLPTQKSILDNAIAEGDRCTSRLLLAIQPAVAQRSVDATSNQSLRDHVLRQDITLAVGLMDEMRAMNVDLAPETLEVVHRHLLDATSHNIPMTSRVVHKIQENVELASRLNLSRQMVSSEVWRNILYQLGKSHRIQALEGLALALVDNFQAQAQRESGFVAVRPADLPFDAQASTFEMPMDLPLHHRWHPIRRIFDDYQFQACIIEWGFKKSLSQGTDQMRHRLPTASCPADFHVARGARLLKELGDRGIPIYYDFLRDTIVRCTVAHLWPRRKQAKAQIKRDLWPALGDVGKLFNAALDVKLVPDSAIEMKDLAVETRRQHLAEHREQRLRKSSSSTLMIP